MCWLFEYIRLVRVATFWDVWRDDEVWWRYWGIEGSGDGPDEMDMNESDKFNASGESENESWLDVYVSYAEEWADWRSQVKMCTKETLEFPKDHLYKENNTSSSVASFCDSLLRKSRHLPFPFSVRLPAAFGSLSRPERTRSKVMRARSAQGTMPE
ncbi:uncharacterized protein EURHEDRAFT_375751 [Aspergillus ruber CBS 135680]|uniref:Uncharacterized protein n=1 Tax=Aspergillus ruber (strain CBS 135680) TaxID=1388766 RepID=A0A017SLJ0_ASPRC|nr:uncharacterized protein EURHEDRAFT_375751 [Aspergillus ruber CBS 135680]EYE97155.1 hypothetical protein EURHEDRAFT_375751 [Aspergillus ruber CBS 135680]